MSRRRHEWSTTPSRILSRFKDCGKVIPVWIYPWVVIVWMVRNHRIWYNHLWQMRREVKMELLQRGITLIFSQWSTTRIMCSSRDSLTVSIARTGRSSFSSQSQMMGHSWQGEPGMSLQSRTWMLTLQASLTRQTAWLLSTKSTTRTNLMEKSQMSTISTKSQCSIQPKSNHSRETSSDWTRTLRRQASIVRVLLVPRTTRYKLKGLLLQIHSSLRRASCPSFTKWHRQSTKMQATLISQPHNSSHLWTLPLRACLVETLLQRLTRMNPKSSQT